MKRRAFVVLPQKLFALLLFPRREATAATARISLPEFLTLSTRLTGRAGLDPAIGRIYLTALLADPDKSRRLVDLARGRSSQSDLEREIIVAWYTGLCKSGREDRLATYRQALVWKALAIPAPGTCGGPLGFWARPPKEFP